MQKVVFVIVMLFFLVSCTSSPGAPTFPEENFPVGAPIRILQGYYKGSADWAAIPVDIRTGKDIVAITDELFEDDHTFTVNVAIDNGVVWKEAFYLTKAKDWVKVELQGEDEHWPGFFVESASVRVSIPEDEVNIDGENLIAMFACSLDSGQQESKLDDSLQCSCREENDCSTWNIKDGWDVKYWYALNYIAEKRNEPASLLAHWKLDETEGDVAHDELGNYDGVYVGEPQKQSLQEGTSLYFDGSSSVRIDNPPRPEKFSVTTWVNPTSGRTNAGIISMIYDTSRKRSGFGLLQRSDNTYDAVVSYNDDSISYYEFGETQPNAWNFLGMTFNGKILKTYIDGQLIAQKVLGPIDYDPLNALHIGQYKDNDENIYYKGYIDDVRMYDGVLTEEEMSELYTKKPQWKSSGGLLAHWTFNEGGGGVARDAAGDHHATVFNPRWVGGISGTALEFDGSGYAAVPQHYDLDGFEREFSLSYWMKQKDPKNEPYIINKYTHNHNGNRGDAYSVSAYKSGKYFFQVANDETWEHSAVSNTLLHDGEWHHIVYVWRRPQTFVYVDGELDYTNNNGFNLPINSVDTPLYLGAIHYGDDDVRPRDAGSLDNLKIYNRALTGQEVKTEHDRGIQNYEEEERSTVLEGSIDMFRGNYLSGDEFVTSPEFTPGTYRLQFRNMRTTANQASFSCNWDTVGELHYHTSEPITLTAGESTSIPLVSTTDGLRFDLDYDGSNRFKVAGRVAVQIGTQECHGFRAEYRLVQVIQE